MKLMSAKSIIRAVLLIGLSWFVNPPIGYSHIVPGYTMTDVLCPCGQYKEACDDDPTDDCDVSNQMFCYEVC